MKGIESAGFLYCTPIQEKCFPFSLKGKDIAGQAQTGTGKTAAFVITTFHRLEKNPASLKGRPKALILAPTRELVHQIYEEIKIIGSFTPFSVAPVFGGIDYKKQEGILREGVDIVVATPGRLIDYLKKKVFSPKYIQLLVIDEADRMFDLGFVKDLRFILRRLPRYSKRQSLLFSATLGYRVMELTYEFMNIPEEVSVTPQTKTLENIKEYLHHVEGETKISLLLGLLSRNSWQRVLIFSNTKANVELLAFKLEFNDYSVCGITGDLPQKERLRIIKRFKTGKTAVLVATDVASRGIHVEDIDVVINFDLPQDPETYVHRIGRTGRVGKAGEAVSLVDEQGALGLEAIELYLNRKICVEWAEDDWFVEDKSPNRKKRTRKPKGFMKPKPRDRKRHPVKSKKRRKIRNRDEKEV